MESEAKERTYASNKLIMAIAESLPNAVTEMVMYARLHGDKEFTDAITEALGLEDDDGALAQLIDCAEALGLVTGWNSGQVAPAITALRQRAESAELKAQAADAAARDYESGLREIFDAVGVPRDKAFVVPDLLAEIQRLRANQIQPGSFVPTGEVRPPQEGEMYESRAGLLRASESHPSVNKFPIYRRIDAPGEQP